MSELWIVCYYFPPTNKTLTPDYVVHIVVANVPKYYVDLHCVCQLKQIVRHIGGLGPTIRGLFLSNLGNLILKSLAKSRCLRIQQPSASPCFPSASCSSSAKVWFMFACNWIRFDFSTQPLRFGILRENKAMPMVTFNSQLTSRH